MEPKKNPKYDVHKKSRMTFFFSLCVSILLVLTAFQWKRPIAQPEPRTQNDGVIDDQLYPPVTELTYTTPTKPTPAKEKPIIINPIEAKKELIEERSIELPSIPNDVPVATIQFSLPPENPDTTFIVVERMPMPKDGYEGLYKFLSKEIKYPKPAIRNNAKGKVFVEFVINKKGEPSNLRVTRGIGYGCDEEAIRVISLTKWSPGKQRGVPVNVRMTVPIQFTLQE